MSIPLLSYDDLGTPQGPPGISNREAFSYDGEVYAGCQSGSFNGDFAETGGCWDRYEGRWEGPAPLRTVPANLSIDGATVTNDGEHRVHEIAADTAFTALCELADIIQLRYPVNLRFVLWSVGEGGDAVQTVEVTQNGPAGGHDPSTGHIGESPTTIAVFNGVPAGSYQLGAQIAGGYQVPISEAFYTELTGDALAPEYFYEEEGNEYFWDYRRNLGRKPSDLNHSFYTLRRELTNSNTTEDVPEWADYCTSGAPDDGEWSQIRVQVGGGEWSQGETLPCPGPALQKRIDDENWAGVPFDSMARCIAASAVIRHGNGLEDVPGATRQLLPGDLIVGGSMSTDTGIASALWRVRSGGGSLTAALLGWNPDPTTGICIAARRNHHITGIRELPDGHLLALSDCRLMRFDPYGQTYSDRLPGYPFSDDGQPGGFSLRDFDGLFSYFTEYLPPYTEDREIFYNRLQEFVEGRRTAGPGTVWHGRECSAALRGHLWGWSQDKAFSDETAQQYLSRIVEGEWDTTAYSSFPATDYHWRQIVACGGRLVCSGVRPSDDAIVPVWGIEDGRSFTEFQCPYVPLYMTVCREASGDVIYAVAKQVVNGALTDDEHIIVIPGSSGPSFPGGQRICSFWNEGDQQFAFSVAALEAAGVNPALMPPYLWWVENVALLAGGTWRQYNEAPVDETVYLEKSTTETTVAYSLPVGMTLPYDAEVWGIICFSIAVGGGVTGPEGPAIYPSCENAECVLELMPEGSHWQIVQMDVSHGPLDAVQIGDINSPGEDGLRGLEREQVLYPVLWCRVDSTAEQSDLSTYTQHLLFNLLQPLSLPAAAKVELCVLWSPEAGEPLMPVIDARE